MSKKRDYSKIFKKIASENQTTVENVYHEMEQAILSGFENSSPDIQNWWTKVPRAGEIPTPEELIEHILNEIMNKP